MSKIQFDSQIEEQFINSFSNFLNINPQWPIKLERSYKKYDFNLYYKEIPIAMIEVVGTNFFTQLTLVNMKPSKSFDKLGRLFNLFKSQSTPLLVLTDSNSFLVWQQQSQIETSQHLNSIESLMNYITQYTTSLSFADGNSRTSKIAHIIYRCIRDYNTQEETTISISINELIKNIKLTGENIASFSLENFEENKHKSDIETRFFSELLGAEEITEFYKYTTFSSAFQSLESKNIRLNGVVGMNDTTESHYADLYLGSGDPSPEPSSADIDDLNRKFIYSCSTFNDNLTMWRLYADDCRGVSIKFSLKPGDNIVKKVSYAKPDKSHPKLDLIKKIIDQLKQNDVTFFLRKFHIWKHFFKPFEYSIENEVRVLYLAQDSVNWCLTTSHNILNPYVLLPFEAFPATIEAIKLGPKCSELPINSKQLESLLRSLKLDHISVEESQISNYR